MEVDKKALVAALRERIEAEIAEATRFAKDAAEAATHEENKPEGDKDMRSTEASYIARGQAERVRTLESALLALSAMPVKRFAEGDVIQVSALVTVDSGAAREHYLLVSAAGGMKISASGVEVQSLAVASPLGKALLGLTAGEDAEVTTPRGPKTYEIVSVV
jgi:transcription elongation GreA/GreB family factor